MSFPAFEECEPVLWKVLAALARGGFIVPPDEARDLIHDFYVEEWAGMTQRYDPLKGPADGYLFVAFHRFARLRIVRLRNWRMRLRDVQQVMDLPSPSPGPDDEAVAHEEIALVRAALARLPERDRRVLLDHLTAEHPSERMLAQRHSLTRYEVRGILAGGFGRLAMELLAGTRDDPESGDLDRRLVLSTWGEGRSAAATAAIFGVPIDRVRAAQKKYVRSLTAAARR